MRFKLQRSNDPQQPYYFEIQAAGNYETLATSEAYVSKADAEHAIDLIKGGAAGATVVDVTYSVAFSWANSLVARPASAGK